MSTAGKMKKVIAEIQVVEEYFAKTRCPYCNAYNESEVYEDNITITETCWSCKKKYKVKIPKNSI